MVGKATVFGVGFVVILGFSALTVSNVASGRVPSLKKAVVNNVRALTTLVGDLSDPILRLDNDGNGTALDLQVGTGTPPMTVNSSTLVPNLNADLIDGQNASNFLQNAGAFLASDTYKTESAVAPGQQLGDGTFVLGHQCDPGDVLLSGGPANIAPTTTLLESFASGPAGTTWSVRINKNGQNDNFSVVLLCVNQQ